MSYMRSERKIRGKYISAARRRETTTSDGRKTERERSNVSSESQICRRDQILMGQRLSLYPRTNHPHPDDMKGKASYLLSAPELRCDEISGWKYTVGPPFSCRVLFGFLSEVMATY